MISRCSISRGGIIPAHAGSTRRIVSTSSRVWDHPRACGEHEINGRTMTAYEGSSPRMRGALKLLKRLGAGLGIIPAHAGSTPPSCRHTRASGDHPRACGEHPLLHIAMPAETGSSPRMRGARRNHEQADRQAGIIPAHAGSTLSASSFMAVRPDHPRACGEHEARTDLAAIREGSSPRMRGARCCPLHSPS